MSKWEKVKLGDIGDFKSGGTPTRSKPEYFEGEIPWITTTSLGKTFIDESDTTVYISEEAVSNSATKIISKNSIMIGIRVGVGKVSINTVPMCTSQDIVSIENVDENQFYKPYIVHCIRSYSQYFDAQKRGATIQGINGGVLKSIDIPLPPLETQKQIATTLDTAAELLAVRKQQLASLENFVKSVYYDMFGDPIINNKRWEVSKLGALFDITSGGTPSTSISSYWNNGDIPWIGSNLCKNDIIYESDGKFLTQLGLDNSSAKLFPSGTVLVALVGATIGKTALLRFETTTNQNVAGIDVTTNENFTSEYVYYSIQGSYYKFMELSNGNFKMANLGFIRNLNIFLPPLQLQTQFANIVTKIEEQKAIVKQAIDETQHLFDSLMSEYFE